MKPSLPGISVLVLYACLILSSCSRHGDVIPPKVLSDIYFDMFVTDQWISDNSDGDIDLRADTMLVYEPIFNRYGYTTEDYDNSVTYYLDKPEKFRDIAQMTSDRFERELSRLREIRSLIEKVEKKNSAYTNYSRKDFTPDSVKWAFGNMKQMIDSILIENKWIISQENTDTLRTR